jgi:hypothetical protein
VSTNLPLSPPATPDNLGNFFDRTLDNAPDDPELAARHFEAALAEVAQFESDPGFDQAKLLLEAFYFQNTAIGALINAADFNTAEAVFAQAVDRFTSLGLTNNADICKGLQMSARANIEIRQQNIGVAQKLLASAQEVLGKDPIQARKYAPIVDDLVIGSLSLTAQQAVQVLSFDEGKVLSEDTALKAEQYAKSYLPEGTAGHFYYLGVAKYYRALFQFNSIQSDFAALSFQEVLRTDGGAEATDIAKTAREAQALLAQATSLEIAKLPHQLSEAMVGLLEAFPVAIKLANALLQGLPSPPIDFSTVKAHLAAAETAAAATGKVGIFYFRVAKRLGEAIENLRQFDSKRVKPVTRPTDPRLPIQLFVIMPFAEQSKVVEQALRAVLEDEPYFFKISLARDSTVEHKLLIDNVKAHMRSADAFLADITGPNPNVMMEVGMVENDPAERSVFLLKRKDEGVDLPTDLKGRLWIEYNLPPGVSADSAVRNLAVELRAKFEGLEELQNLSLRPHSRYTSFQYMRRKLQQKKLALNDDELAAIQKMFPSIEDLEAATKEAIALKTGFDDDVAASVVKAFSNPKLARAATE